MILSAPRSAITRACLALLLVITIGVFAKTVVAQVTCYRTKCVLYPDGSRICERQPVDCATVPIQ
jgi:hypothetical protein